VGGNRPARALARLATVVMASTAPMTASDSAVLISGTAALSPCAQCKMSFTPMKHKINASPTDRYTSRSSSPVTRKNSARRPSSANALAANTMYASSVTPNTAGIESSANSTSVPPMAMNTMNSGVTIRCPPSRVISRPSSNWSLTGRIRRATRTRGPSATSGSACWCASSRTAVQIRTRPKIKNMNDSSSSSTAPTAMKPARRHSAVPIPKMSTRCWCSRGTAKDDMMTTKTNRLSTDRLSSTM
jgi:hypothetical protein